MKKIHWYKALSLTDEAYLAEANPQNETSSKKISIVLPALVACACLLLSAAGLWLFLPFDTSPPDVSAYEKSAYFDLIQKLNTHTWTPPENSNNFEYIYDGLVDNVLPGIKNEAMDDGAIPEDMVGAAGSVPENENGTYQEITDNQVEGIIEADRIKRSDKYIFYLDNQNLRIFSIAGSNSAELGRFDCAQNDKTLAINQWEFYLSQDCKTAIIITQYRKESKKPIVGILALDVSDPANIVEKKRVELTGSYLSSRITDGKLLLMTEFVIDGKALDFDDPGTFLPQVDSGNGLQALEPEEIVCPDTLNNTRYTVIIQLDENTLESLGESAYLSYSEDVYVSQNHIFLTRVYADISESEDGGNIRNAMTEISCLDYSSNALIPKGSVVVRGYVKDQWSMDEYQNILRVVTTTNATKISALQGTVDTVSGGSYVSQSILTTATGNANASLYCVDLTSFEVVASVIDFAPPREEVQSVRFDKETAYVCTSIEMSDPVFFFDLSDINNITYKDTGTIEGFSSSLVNFGNGYLLGIGQENWGTFKAEIYEETEDGVRSVCAYTLEFASYSNEYKSYYIDRENQLLGLGITDFSKTDKKEDSRYILLYFDGYNIEELLNESLNGYNEAKRSVYIDDYFYMFGNEDFKVKKVF